MIQFYNINFQKAKLTDFIAWLATILDFKEYKNLKT